MLLSLGLTFVKNIIIRQTLRPVEILNSQAFLTLFSGIPNRKEVSPIHTVPIEFRVLA
jgi:hypothetical protein